MFPAIHRLGAPAGNMPYIAKPWGILLPTQAGDTVLAEYKCSNNLSYEFIIVDQNEIFNGFIFLLLYRYLHLVLLYCILT